MTSEDAALSASTSPSAESGTLCTNSAGHERLPDEACVTVAGIRASLRSTVDGVLRPRIRGLPPGLRANALRSRRRSTDEPDARQADTRIATGAQGATGPKGDQGPQGVPGPLSGAAGGSLTGTYPNPGIANGAVGSSQLAIAPAVRLSTASSPTISTSSAATVRWSAIDYEVGGDLFKPPSPNGAVNCDTSAYADYCRLYAPIPGIYDISAGVAWADLHTSGGSRWVGIVQTSPPNRILAAVGGPNDTFAAVWTQQIVSTQMRLSAGESVFVRVMQYGNADTQLESGQNRTFFAMRWVGRSS